MTGYFAKFPLYYTQTPDGKNVIIKDFFRRVDVSDIFGNVAVGLVPYLVQVGERPEDVSNKFYGSPLYHWVILLVNNIVDTYEEWPLDDIALNNKIADVYHSPYDIHHYVDTSNGYTIDYNAENANCQPVLNVEYEIAINDAKRQIRVLDPQYLSQFVSNFNDLIGE